MAIAVRSACTGGTTTGAADGTFAIIAPASIANSDYLVAVVGKEYASVVAPDAGWTVAASAGITTQNDRYAGIFYKYVTNAAGEPATYTFDSASTSEPVGWWVAALSGISSNSPQDVAFSGTGAWTAYSNDTSPTAPAVTTACNGAFALACWVVNTDSAITMPGGSWDTRAQNVGGNGCLSVASQTFATGGTSTGATDITNVATGMDSYGGTFVF